MTRRKALNWLKRTNPRRGELIKKKVRGALTEEERVELDLLQKQCGLILEEHFSAREREKGK